MMSSSNVFHRSLHSELPQAARADGNYIYLEDGRKLLDGSSGAAVSSIGHGNQRVIAAILNQLQTVDYVFCGTFSNKVNEILCETGYASIRSVFVFFI